MPTVYILGAGIAGWLAAWTIARRQPGRKIYVLDQADRPAMGLTAGNGRSLTATEGLVAAGLSVADWRRVLATTLNEGGYLVPDLPLTPADRDVIDRYLAGVEAAEADRDSRELAMVELGRRNLDLWRDFAQAEPTISARSGLHLGPKLRIYEGPRAEERADREVRLLQAAGYHEAALVSWPEAIALEPGLTPYIQSRLTPTGQFPGKDFPGAIVCQPGGAIEAKHLVQDLAERLLAGDRVEFWGNCQVQMINRDATGRILNLTIAHAGETQLIGRTEDHYLIATGFDQLLESSGLVNESLFPVVGTSIVLPIPPDLLSDPQAFTRRAWKHDAAAGPLVISPTCQISDDYLAWLDRLEPTIDPTDLTAIAGSWLNPVWLTQAQATGLAIDRRRLDPRQIDHTDLASLGPAAGPWQIRIGGCKFYPGVALPLDLNHPGARWAIAAQLASAQAWFPTLIDRLLTEWGQGHLRAQPITPQDLNPDLLAQIQAWVGARPVYASGSARIGQLAHCPNGLAIVGTGSWGLAGGPAYADLVANGLD